jgi:HEAT repeat protein
MNTSCPTCNKSVDPLRSRFVGVQGGKVVAYCSAECAALAPFAPPAAAPELAAPLMERSEMAGVGPPKAVAAGQGASSVGPTGAPAGPPRLVTPASGVPIDLDSGPVIQIVHEPSSGVVASAREPHTEPRPERPRRGPVEPASARHDDARESPAAGGVAARSHTDRALSQGEPDGDVAPPRRSRVALVLFLLLLAAAGGVLAYRYLVKHDVAAAMRVLPAPATAATQVAQLEPAEPPGPSAVEVAPVIDVVAVVEQARAILQAELTATSQRLSRIAAAALARTQDPTACDALAAQLGLAGARARSPRRGAAGRADSADSADSAGPADSARSGAPGLAWQQETSEIARLDIAYSLARAGDKRGSNALAAALRSQRSDARDEAARLLALLGDHRAVPRLTALLAISQRRLGAAEHLAHLAEPRALKVLEALRGAPRTSADDKTRATIALGIAGRADVAPALRDMLGDPHFNAFAAAALAELKDDAARPVLVRQLESPTLRVRAARALRRLDPALDPTPLLPALLPVLATGRDTDQVQAAEAILLLAGPASWSSYE